LFNKYENPNEWRISKLKKPYYNPAGKFGWVFTFVLNKRLLGLMN
jgi:hypothetical protein